MSIFKAYDIRGVVGVQITEELAFLIGKAAADVLGAKTILVGKDMRTTSEPFKKQLVKGILEQGASVIEIGLCTTPMFYWAVNFLEADAGIMVTASHNPSEYNGFKLVRKGAVPVTYDNGIKQIEEVVKRQDFRKGTTKGSVTQKNVQDAYIRFIRKLMGMLPPMRIVVDTSNGMEGLTLGDVFEGSPLSLVHFNKALDGSFPCHPADTLKQEAYKDVIPAVTEEGAAFGAVFDGDADRIGFVDEKGNIVGNDIITALLAPTFGRGQVILYDVRSSWAVKEEIEKAGSTPIIWRVGHSFIKEEMRRRDAVFAGELSGHYYYKDHFYTESSLLTLAKVAQVVAKHKKPLSEIIKPLQRYVQSGEINSEVEDKEKVLARIKGKYGDGNISEIDGITIEYPDFWFNIRPSNTEPLLRLNLEAKSKELMDAKVKEVLGIIRA